MNRVFTLLCLASIVFYAGCFNGEKTASVEKAPEWVTNTPDDNQYKYAVGVSGRTFYPTDAIKYATEKARQELARMIKTEVTSTIHTEDRGRRAEISISSLAETDEVLQGSQKCGHWVDKDGITGVAPGTTYVLIRMEKEQYKRLLSTYR